MELWYSRPVWFVADVARTLDFYVGKLGFAESWRHVEDGQLLVAQVAREGCEIIFSCQWPEKVGRAMLFVSLSSQAFAALPDQLAEKGVASREGNWGYRCLVVADPDGNELYFPAPDEKGPA